MTIKPTTQPCCDSPKNQVTIVNVPSYKNARDFVDAINADWCWLWLSDRTGWMVSIVTESEDKKISQNL